MPMLNIIITTIIIIILQVTTHSHLLSSSDINDMSASLEIKGIYFSLHEFDTEVDFSNKIR